MSQSKPLPPSLPQPARRRALTQLSHLGALGAMGAVGGASLAPVGRDDEAQAAAMCLVSAQETAGPYPLSQVLDMASIVRRDITEGKPGIPLMLSLRIVDFDNGCTPLVGAAVYVWHCDAAGEYSGYTSGENGTHSGETYLRGVQITNAQGKVTFKTIFPGWYVPRLTHIHVQVFLANTTLSSTGAATTTTQLCFPDAITKAAYSNTTLYPKGQNTVTATASADQVFGNGTTSESLVVSGTAGSGYLAGITIGVSSSANSSESGDAASSGSGAGTPPTGTPPAAPGTSGPYSNF